TRVIPAGIVRQLLRAARGDRQALVGAAALPLAVGCAAVGYVYGYFDEWLAGHMTRAPVKRFDGGFPGADPQSPSLAAHKRVSRRLQRAAHAVIPNRHRTRS